MFAGSCSQTERTGLAWPEGLLVGYEDLWRKMCGKPQRQGGKFRTETLEALAQA